MKGRTGDDDLELSVNSLDPGDGAFIFRQLASFCHVTGMDQDVTFWQGCAEDRGIF